MGMAAWNRFSDQALLQKLTPARPALARPHGHDSRPLSIQGDSGRAAAKKTGLQRYRPEGFPERRNGSCKLNISNGEETDVECTTSGRDAQQSKSLQPSRLARKGSSVAAPRGRYRDVQDAQLAAPDTPLAAAIPRAAVVGGYRTPRRQQRYIVLPGSSTPEPLVLLQYPSPAAGNEELLLALAMQPLKAGSEEAGKQVTNRERAGLGRGPGPEGWPPRRGSDLCTEAPVTARDPCLSSRGALPGAGAGRAVVVAKGSSLVYLAAHVLSNVGGDSARAAEGAAPPARQFPQADQPQLPWDRFLMTVTLSASGQACAVSVHDRGAARADGAGQRPQPPPKPEQQPAAVLPPTMLLFRPYAYDKDKSADVSYGKWDRGRPGARWAVSGGPIVCTHYLRVQLAVRPRPEPGVAGAAAEQRQGRQATAVRGEPASQRCSLGRGAEASTREPVGLAGGWRWERLMKQLARLPPGQWQRWDRCGWEEGAPGPGRPHPDAHVSLLLQQARAAGLRGPASVSLHSPASALSLELEAPLSAPGAETEGPLLPAAAASSPWAGPAASAAADEQQDWRARRRWFPRLLVAVNRSNHLQLKKEIRMELSRNGWVVVAAVGVVGVDKCLQALAVACTEVVSASGGTRKLVASVRKLPICVELQQRRPQGFIFNDDDSAWGDDFEEHFEHGSSGGNLSAPWNAGGMAQPAAAARPMLQSREGLRTGFVFEAWLCDSCAFRDL